MSPANKRARPAGKKQPSPARSSTVGPGSAAPRTSSGPAAQRVSARQERLARRRLDPELRRASTSGRIGGLSPIAIGTLIAVVIGVVLIGYAFLNTQPSGGSLKSPDFVTDAAIPQGGASGTTLGQASAPVTVDLWEDYQCTACGYFSQQVEPSLVREYVATGKVKLTYHDYLIIDKNLGTTQSLQGANGARCAGDQGKYWQFHDWLFFNQGAEGSDQYSTDRLLQVGKLVGLDNSVFQNCVRNGDHYPDIRAQSGASPVTSTPGILVQGTKLTSAAGATAIPTYTELKAAIDKAISAAPASSAASPSVSPAPPVSASPTTPPAASPSAS